MTGLKARSLASALAITAISAVAYVAPGAASATTCSGANITGNGSSLQANAQQKNWSKPFDEREPCFSEGKEQVTYLSTGSGPGLASWWVGHEVAKYKGFGPANAFVGTDQPPNEKQEKDIIEKGPGAKVLTIPVAQAAVALPIHLPNGCLATGGKKGKVKRLVLHDSTLEGIFNHTIKTWGEVPGVVGATCEKTAPIVRVVRKEGSGTTAIFKKFLFETNKEPVAGGLTWSQLAEESQNVVWPAEAENLEKKEKGSGIATYVAATPGTIGYANLNEVRANAAFTPAGGGGDNTAVFWPELYAKATKYQDPSTNGESNTPANAHCAGESYIRLDGVGKQAKFPPESAEDLWNEVTANKVQKASYPLCGFTYDLSLTKFSDFLGSEPLNEPIPSEVETIKNYYGEAVLSSTGQKSLEGSDFLGLPEGKTGHVLKIAKEGLLKVAY
jgi:ABC-type phosphate transport system substrate-binding protein